MVESLHDEAEGVPFDIPFVLLGVVTEQDTVLVDFNEDGANFEDYSLKPHNLCNRLDGPNGLNISLSSI